MYKNSSSPYSIKSNIMKWDRFNHNSMPNLSRDYEIYLAGLIYGFHLGYGAKELKLVATSSIKWGEKIMSDQIDVIANLINNRLNQTDDRLKSLEKRFDDLSYKIDSSKDDLSKEINSSKEKLTEKLNSAEKNLGNEISKINETLARIDSRLSSIEDKNKTYNQYIKPAIFTTIATAIASFLGSFIFKLMFH